MRITSLLFFFTVSFFFTAVQHVNGQDKSKKWPPEKYPHDSKNCFHLLSNSYQCDWIFYGIKSTLEGSVVAYDTVQKDKKGPAPAFVTMLKAGRDTVRVLHLAAGTYKIGDVARFTQIREPELDLLAPFDRDFFISEEDKGHVPQCRINEYDGRIRKTTWGKIVTQAASAPKKIATKNPVTKKP